MRNDKGKAIELRRLGKSYNEIHAALKVPKATLSGWFKELDWSAGIKKRLACEVQAEHGTRLLELNRVRGEHLKRAYDTARTEAEAELEMLKYNPLFIAGIMLYWGEGGKNPKDGVKFTNADAKMVAFYLAFLTKACRIPVSRIKGHLLLYPDLEERTCRSYWSKISGIPQENFTKSTIIAGRHKTRRLNWGICVVTVSSLYFKQKMLRWMELLPEELLKKEYYANIAVGSDTGI